MTLKEKISLYLFGFITTGRVLSIQLPELIFYGAILVVLILMYINPKEPKLNNKGIFIFILVLFAGILLNDIPSYFKPFIRFALFFMNILVFAPLFVSKRLMKFRNHLFFVICNLFSIYTLISFGGLLIGIFPVLGFGGFQGVAVHAMTMSIIASISFLFNLANYLIKRKYIYIICIAISFIVIILGASRAALLGTLIGTSILIFKNNNFEFASLKLLLGSLILMIGLIFVMPDEYLGRIAHKFERTEELGNVFSSRQSLWDARYYEFKTSPIYGIGFNNILVEHNDFGVSKESGVIQTGSSWGMILSMSGLLGITTFLIFIIKRYRIMLLKSIHSTRNSLVIGVFSFFLVHMIFEGYIFASGSIFMILFWLTVSMTYFNFKKV